MHSSAGRRRLVDPVGPRVLLARRRRHAGAGARARRARTSSARAGTSPVRRDQPHDLRRLRPAGRARPSIRRQRADSAANDYRVLQPAQVTDANGNRSEVAFDALGLVVGTAVMGKTDRGARRLARRLRRRPRRRDGPGAPRRSARQPAAMLGDATRASSTTCSPIIRTRDDPQPRPPSSTRWRARRTSRTSAGGADPLPARASPTRTGSAARSRTRSQAEPGPLVDRRAGASTPRWVATGWTDLQQQGQAGPQVRAVLHGHATRSSSPSPPA